MDFTGKYDSCSESSDKEMSAKELVETYGEFLAKWKEYFLR